MVSRVDVHMYSMASAIKDPSTTSLSWKHFLRLQTEAPIHKAAVYTSLSRVEDIGATVHEQT